MIFPEVLDIMTGNLEIFMETPVEIYENLVSDYGQDIADNTYRMAALETGHFKSWGWKQALNQGMEKFGADYPPEGPITMTEAGTGNSISYLEFPTPEASLYTLAEWLSRNNNDPSKWNPGQDDYIDRVNSIKLPNS
jgi:hypothetical protein